MGTGRLSRAEDGSISVEMVLTDDVGIFDPDEAYPSAYLRPHMRVYESIGLERDNPRTILSAGLKEVRCTFDEYIARTPVEVTYRDAPRRRRPPMPSSLTYEDVRIDNGLLESLNVYRETLASSARAAERLSPLLSNFEFDPGPQVTPEVRTPEPVWMPSTLTAVDWGGIATDIVASGS